jgi:hypothetical protein
MDKSCLLAISIILFDISGLTFIAMDYVDHLKYDGKDINYFATVEFHNDSIWWYDRYVYPIDDFDFRLASIPKEIIEGVDIIFTDDSPDSYAGLYYSTPKETKILVWNYGYIWKYAEDTLWHELGHHWYHRLGLTERTKADLVCVATKKRITDYAGRSCSENWAEIFACAFNKQKQLGYCPTLLTKEEIDMMNELVMNRIDDVNNLTEAGNKRW